MSSHTFNAALAIDYNVETSLFLGCLEFWLKINIINKSKKHYHEGKWWVYNSYDSWTELLPYYTAKQIRRIIASAEQEGLIETGNFNKKDYDLTKWYTLTAKAMEYFPLSIEQFSTTPAQMGKTPAQMGKTPAQMGRPIPVTNPVTNPDIKTKKITPHEYEESYFPIPEQKKSSLSTVDIINNNPHKIPISMIDDWLINRKAKRSPLTHTAWAQVNQQLTQCKNPIEAFQEMVSRGWVSIKAEWINKNTKKAHFDNESTEWISRMGEELF